LFFLLALRSFRRRPMTSPSGRPMRLAGGEERNHWLADGHKMEMKLKAAEHDVWLAGDEVEIVRYPAYLKPFHECRVCGFWTAKFDGLRVETPPTESETGWGYELYLCRNCGNEERSHKILPKRTSSAGSGGYGGSWSSGNSSSSSWSSGDSGGSSDWGGGDSGGGGADSSW
jgi:uncharacterized protein